MSEVTETLVVDGIHCMQCPPKIAAALRGVDGLTGGSATLAGDVTVTYDGLPGTRDAIVTALTGAGFPLRAIGDLR